MAEEVKTEKEEEKTPQEKEAKKEEVEVTPEPEVTTLSEEEKKAEAEKKAKEAKELPPEEDYSKKVQKRINKLTTEKYKLLKRAEIAEAKLKETGVTTPATTVEKPNREKYETEDDYSEALVNYQVDQRLQKQKVEDTKVEFEADKKKSEGVLEVDKKRKLDAFDSKQIETRKKYEDFDKIAHAADVPYSNIMGSLVMDSEIGPELAYYFGKNRDEATRVSRLTVESEVIEAIGEIETKLTLEPEKKKITNAPPPINPVRGSEEVEIDLDKAPYEPYRAKRMQDIRKVAKGGG